MTHLLEIIFSNTIVAFIILIGIVVFVHELGHFLVGKFFGIQVEEFSIGFGPKAFSFKKGTTEYRINWLPLGGYVRFYGADIEEKIPLEAQEKSILHAKVYKRALVSFAGPFANFILSFIIIAGLLRYGIPEPQAIISVVPQSVAEKSGLRSGDKIVSINHKDIHNWAEFSEVISLSPNQQVNLQYERDGHQNQIQIIPLGENVETVFGNEQLVGRIGVSALFASSHPVIFRNSFLNAVGLQTGDTVISLNDKKIDFLFQLKDELKALTGCNSDLGLAQKILSSAPPPEISITFQRDTVAETKTINFTNVKIKTWAQNFLSLQNKPMGNWEHDFLSTDQTISGFPNLAATDKQIPAQKAWQQCGLKAGDTLYSLSQEKIYSFVQFATWLERTSKKFSAQTLNQSTMSLPVSLTVFTEKGEFKSLSCDIPLRKGYDNLNRENMNLDFPVTFKSHGVTFPQKIISTTSVPDIAKKSFFYVLNQINLTFNGIKMLVTGHIPLSNLGGPIAIANAAGDAAKMGLMAFLFMMSFISTNIGFMNLLPLPALDGGALLLHAVEAAYGKPLPKGVQIAVQRAGILILLSLFVLVFYNDILRLIRF